MKRAMVVMIAVLAFGPLAMAQYMGPWLYQWDFNNGQQGWVKQAGPGYWVDPVWMPNGPTLPDGAPSGAGGGNLYSPDGTWWTFDLPTAHNKFVIQADLWIPNLDPLSGFPNGLPGNGLQNAGVGAVNVEGKRMYVSGRSDNNGLRTRDHSWDNTNRERSWILTENAPFTGGIHWDDWVTMQFDYNWTTPGKFTARLYTPFVSPVHPGGWWSFADYDIHPDPAKQFITQLILGSVNPTASSWTQTQIDNVKFIPEPATMALLTLGVLPLLRRRRA